MRLTPTERDRILLFTAAELARARLRRGLRLNIPEATAIIADTVCEAARDGLTLQDAVAAGIAVLRPDQVLDGVADVLTQVQVEALFDDGTRIAVVTAPLAAQTANDQAPGAVIATQRPPAPARATTPLRVTNTSDVPVSITSHFHFFEVNRLLRFDRAAAYGQHLAIPAGTVVRFDPGTTRDVTVTPIRGNRIAVGFAGLVDGALDTPGALEAALKRARDHGYLGADPAGDSDE